MTVPPFRTVSPLEQAVAHIDARLTTLEALIMALDASFARMQAAITELASDISAANQRVTDRLTAMQATLDRFVADDTTEDAAFQATIDDLRRQLEAALADQATVATRLDSMTTAVTQASTAVEGIAPQQPPA